MTTGRINQIAFVEKNNHESEDSGFEGRRLRGGEPTVSSLPPNRRLFPVCVCSATKFSFRPFRGSDSPPRFRGSVSGR